ncbi:ATP-binding cassette domain-containing protein [Pseudokineococcus lusitanus]|uniref:Peptide/nickel transport system ATP-binding protein n=1 Tax=Pseudokineococcus lusitanus TaxID=763993 RepID=A0A3N1G9V4_9ACTN|nr:ATP-binding cassette domain-containing protein [Pseudokineococcus lusitanus]ROP27019.1 peptide/nickel transport system ATP-binding protein [Pseudokineococcus lusitanus]
MPHRRPVLPSVARHHRGGRPAPTTATPPAHHGRPRAGATGTADGTAADEPVLEVSDLRVEVPATRRDATVPLLRGVDLAVGAGERVALVGASGSGKSLTAAAVRGQLPPGLRAQGRVRLGGADVLDVPGPRRPVDRRPAVVLQDPSAALHPLVAVGAQVAMPLRARHDRAGRRPGRAAARRAVLELLAAVGLEDPRRVAAGRPAELSGGQRQRVALAVALAAAAPLVVADEPTTALDTVTQAAVLDVLADRTGPGRAGLLLVTHDLAVAAALCSRVAVVADGRVVETGPTARVLAAPGHPAARALVGADRAGGTDPRAGATVPAPAGVPA